MKNLGNSLQFETYELKRSSLWLAMCHAVTRSGVTRTAVLANESSDEFYYPTCGSK